MDKGLQYMGHTNNWERDAQTPIAQSEKKF